MSQVPCVQSFKSAITKGARKWTSYRKLLTPPLRAKSNERIISATRMTPFTKIESARTQCGELDDSTGNFLRLNREGLKLA